MFKLIKVDLFKTINLKSFILIFLIPIIMSFIGFMNIYRGLIQDENLWNSIYNQTMILYCGLTLPLSLSITIALQWKIEYDKNNILNLNSTPQHLKNIYLSKLSSTLYIAFVNILISTILTISFAHILNPTDPFKPYLIYGPILAFCFSIPFICLQHFISILTKNFIFSVGIGILLSLFGFILSGTSLGILVPNNYIFYGSVFGTPFNKSQCSLFLIVLVPILSAILFYLGNLKFSKKEF